MSDSPGWTSPGAQPQPGAQPPTDPAPHPPRGAGQGPGGPPPTPPPPPPPAPPGWGSWYRQPLAAKPGVIPLRPLGIGEILDGAVATARAHWRTVLAISLGVAVVIQVISTIATRVWLNDSSGLAALENNPEPTTEEIEDAFGDLFAYVSLTGLAALLGTLLATALLTVVVSRAVLGRSVTLPEAWQDARPRLPRLLGLSLLVCLIVVLVIVVPILLAALTGYATLVVFAALGGLLLAVWLSVRYSLAAPALMLERRGVTHAMRRSWKLVDRSWWRVFGILLLILLLMVVVSSIVELPVSVIAAVVSGEGVSSVLDGTVTGTSWSYLAITGVGSVISSTITLPLGAGVVALLYIDLRIRREALDLELARAAGVGSPQDG